MNNHPDHCKPEQSAPIEQEANIPKLPPKLLHKRLAAQRDSSTTTSESQPGHSPPQNITNEPTAQPSPKLLKITTSKILGTALPRKPRVGPEYQASIPDVQIKPQK
jgi:hypothetical protein